MNEASLKPSVAVHDARSNCVGFVVVTSAARTEADGTKLIAAVANFSASRRTSCVAIAVSGLASSIGSGHRRYALCIKHVGEKATVFNIMEMTCFMLTSWAYLLTVKQDTVKTSNRILDTLWEALVVGMKFIVGKQLPRKIARLRAPNAVRLTS